MDEAAHVVARVHPTRPGVRNVGYTHLTSLWKHGPCSLPQHRPKMKYTPTITLHEWQRRVVEEYPGLFVRGLFYSDGCRVTKSDDSCRRG